MSSDMALKHYQTQAREARWLADTARALDRLDPKLAEDFRRVTGLPERTSGS